MTFNAQPQPLRKRKPCILAVDDSRVLLATLCATLKEFGYDVLQAENGSIAYDLIKANHADLDAVLLDREMPVMNGMQLVAKLKQDRLYSKIPLIMQTASDRPEQIREGIDAGVFYYLLKPLNTDILRSVLSAALRESEQIKALSRGLSHEQAGLDLIEECSMSFSTVNEAGQIAGFLARCFPEPERAVGGLAELLINAIEHGNLGIGYDEKTRLLNSGRWREEIARRAESPEFGNRRAEARFRRTQEGCSVTIRDQGDGFDWQSYMRVDPSRASDNHGRGIAQAAGISFDRLSYNDKGNEVTAFASSSARSLEW